MNRTLALALALFASSAPAYAVGYPGPDNMCCTEPWQDTASGGCYCPSLMSSCSISNRGTRNSSRSRTAHDSSFSAEDFEMYKNAVAASNTGGTILDQWWAALVTSLGL